MMIIIIMMITILPTTSNTNTDTSITYCYLAVVVIIIVIIIIVIIISIILILRGGILRSIRRREHMVGVNMVLAESVKFKHSLYKSCGIDCVEGIMLEACLLQPCLHVTGPCGISRKV